MKCCYLFDASFVFRVPDVDQDLDIRTGTCISYFDTRSDECLNDDYLFQGPRSIHEVKIQCTGPGLFDVDDAASKLESLLQYFSSSLDDHAACIQCTDDGGDNFQLRVLRPLLTRRRLSISSLPIPTLNNNSYTVPHMAESDKPPAFIPE